MQEGAGLWMKEESYQLIFMNGYYQIKFHKSKEEWMSFFQSKEYASTTIKTKTFLKRYYIEVNEAGCFSDIYQQYQEPISNSYIKSLGDRALRFFHEEISIFDTFASREKSVEHCVLAEESFLEQLNKIEKAFLLGQNRAESKRLLSMLLTALLLDVKQEDIEYVSNLLQKYTFISKELIELVRKLNKKLTNREIAVICGTSEQNASRALKKFRDKLKENG